MQRTSISSVTPGMINARNIFNAQGKILLAKGIVLNDFYINRLKGMGIESIFVLDGITDDLAIPEVISEETRVKTVRGVKEVFNNIATDRSVDSKAISGLVGSLVDEILTNSGTLIQISEIRAFDDYTFYHSVNVCVLSLLIGVSFSFNELQLRDLGIGAILHDLGKIKVPKSILEKPDKLTPEEFEEIKKHSFYGFEILKKYFEFSLLSAHVAFQHHERYNGSGYPRGLQGNEINQFSRIVAVADVYDALLADRVYRKAFKPAEAIKEIINGIGKEYDPEVVKKLLENVAVYPVGSLVELNTGEIGVVIDVKKRARHHPIVLILTDDKYNSVFERKEIDLSKREDVLINRIIEDQNMYTYLRKMIS
ncbi:MAG: HD-GYP domain-containing protein [Firmicutes bacterium]|nr:HD-GYP domain-containing protein [Bacillota bacterium]